MLYIETEPTLCCKKKHTMDIFITCISRQNMLAVPPVTLDDFTSVITRCHARCEPFSNALSFCPFCFNDSLSNIFTVHICASVAPSELKQFEKWTEEFGEEGA